jgi:hypothetical protein
MHNMSSRVTRTRYGTGLFDLQANFCHRTGVDKQAHTKARQAHRKTTRHSQISTAANNLPPCGGAIFLVLHRQEFRQLCFWRSHRGQLLDQSDGIVAIASSRV